MFLFKSLFSQGKCAMGSHLTKSKYTAGLQCLRRLWLQVNEPLPYEEPEAGSAFAVGQEVGKLAQSLFPLGVLVEEKPWEHDAAVLQTQKLMADKSVPAIFEAAFEYEGVRVRIDVLERQARNCWCMCEVKSSGQVKDQYLDDCAIQSYVLTGAGVKLSGIDLVHINKNYVRSSRGLDVKKLFVRADIKSALKPFVAEVPSKLEEMRKILRKRSEPAINIGKQCNSPYSCEFVDRCWAGLPSDMVSYLPRISDKKLSEFESLGIKRVKDIPSSFALNPQHERIRRAIISGKVQVEKSLGSALSDFEPPIMYLDFEAMNPAVPLYAGTRPFEVIPFQWSLHIIDKKGKLQHFEFLAQGDKDPRLEFVESLIKAVGKSKTPIMVYSSYENTQLKKLCEAFPDKAKAIKAIMARLVDLLPVVSNHIYHPDFNFSASIKYVAPALCPKFGYSDLEQIADGGAASAAFVAIASGEVSEKDAQNLRKALLAYCERDTLAMVKTHKALRKIAMKS